MARIYQAFPIEDQVKVTALYSLFTLDYHSSYHFLGESHAFWECVFVIRGTLCVSADDRIYNMAQGEIIFHKPLEFHKFHVTDSEGARLLVFSFSAEGPRMCELQDKVFSLSGKQLQILEDLMRDSQEDEPGVSRLTPMLNDPGYGQRIGLYLQQLFLSLTEDGTVLPVSLTPDAITFQKAINYLTGNLHRQPSISEIAAYCSISSASLKRLFDRFAGVSVHKYLLKLKIRTAEQLLKSHESVTQVAEKLGFSSQSYFSKAYKRESGRNPSDER